MSLGTRRFSVRIPSLLDDVEAELLEDVGRDVDDEDGDGEDGGVTDDGGVRQTTFFLAVGLGTSETHHFAGLRRRRKKFRRPKNELIKFVVWPA